MCATATATATATHCPHAGVLQHLIIYLDYLEYLDMGSKLDALIGLRLGLSSAITICHHRNINVRASSGQASIRCQRPAARPRENLIDHILGMTKSWATR